MITDQVAELVYNYIPGFRFPGAGPEVHGYWIHSPTVEQEDAQIGGPFCFLLLGVCGSIVALAFASHSALLLGMHDCERVVFLRFTFSPFPRGLQPLASRGGRHSNNMTPPPLEG